MLSRQKKELVRQKKELFLEGRKNVTGQMEHSRYSYKLFEQTRRP